MINSFINKKNKPLEEGGLRDEGVRIASFQQDSYSLIPDSFLTTNRANFVEYSDIFKMSSTNSSTYSKYPPALSEKKDANGDCVHSSEIKDYSQQDLINKILQNMQQFLSEYISSKNNITTFRDSESTYSSPVEYKYPI